MTVKDIVDSTLFFVSQWCGTTLPRFVSVFAGITACLLVSNALWERKIRALTGALCLGLGLMLIVIGMNTDVLHWLVAASYLTRIRLLMGFLSVVVLAVTFEAIRRSHLKERYALLWVATGMIILLCAFFPQVMNFATVFLGVQYITAVVAVVFTFLVLVAFHFSIALSEFFENQTRIAQRCALLETRLDQLTRELKEIKGEGPQPDRILEPIREPNPPVSGERRWRGSSIVVPLVIATAALAVLWVGLAAPQAMVGDEVTHYFMMIRQANLWPHPNFLADIPTGWGENELRSYPHTFWWHYGAAFLYRFVSESFTLTQLYQTLFWLQFLVAGAWLARGRRTGNTPDIALFVIILASLPMGLMFAVTFYQDIPAAAQVLTAFCLLDRRKWLGASLFLALAIGIKETSLLFVLPFFVLLAWRLLNISGETGSAPIRLMQRLKGLVIPAMISALIVSVPSITTAVALKNIGLEYYPSRQFHEIVDKWMHRDDHSATLQKPVVQGEQPPMPTDGTPRHVIVHKHKGEVISNSPGDLRLPVNYLLYGGVLLWSVLLLGAAGWMRRIPSGDTSVKDDKDGGGWPFWVGVAYLVPLAFLLRSAPDARFFLPGLPFVILPFVNWSMRLPRPNVIVVIFASVAILQGGQVLQKTYEMRGLSPDVKAAIEYLREHPPVPRYIFMYPEGNYRFFPSPHNWYLNYYLRQFWKCDNDGRIDILHQYHIGAIVVKKKLVGPVDARITNLGVYPDYFVRDVENDARFQKVFDSKTVAIYQVPRPIVTPQRRAGEK